MADSELTDAELAAALSSVPVLALTVPDGGLPHRQQGTERLAGNEAVHRRVDRTALETE